MKNMLVIPLAFVLLLNATCPAEAGSVEINGFANLPPIHATNGSTVYAATGQSRIEINGSNSLHNDVALKYALFGCVFVLVGAVVLSSFPSPRIIIGGIDARNILAKKTSINAQPGQIKQDISLYKQFMQWIVSSKTTTNDYFNNLEYRRVLFSFDSNLLPDTETSADRIAKEIIRFKLLCAEEHLKLFGYQQSLATCVQSVEKYNAAKNYKMWYDASLLPKIFWFCYQKPNLHDFYKLQMQYRYIKYKQQCDLLGLQQS